jgi:uncharacterized HAD superfamily protein
MSKPIIAVDIDDVVSSQADVLMAFSNERYNTNLTREDFKKPGDYWGYFEHVWGESAEEGARRFQEFLDEGYPYRQTVDPEVLAALQHLKQRYRLEVVTSRGEDFRDGTVRMLQDIAKNVFSNIHFVYLWDQPDKKATKAKVCQEIGAGYLIDDSVDHCNLAAEAGIHALLFGELGWTTSGQAHPDVVRVKDWAAVLEYFDGRS